jgi:hypothetical protein
VPEILIPQLYLYLSFRQMRRRSEEIEEWRISKSSQVCAKHFRGTAINGDKMKRLVPNAVLRTSNYESYEEITLSEEIINISNDDTITGESLLDLKTNIEMRMGSNLQEMGLFFCPQSGFKVYLRHSAITHYLTNANTMTGLVYFEFFH